jgi:hypothetical protein
LLEKKSLARLDGGHNYGYWDLCSKKNQAIPLNYTWLSCTLPRFTYHRFIDPFLNKKEGRLVDTSPQKWEQRMFTGLSA